MKKEDWKVFRCPKCMRDDIYYMPALSKDEKLRKLELKEYKEDFGATLSEDGKFIITCETCGREVKELHYEKWNSSTICEVLGNILEDNNKHSITRIGHLFKDCMIKAGAEDKCSAALRELLSYYSEHESFQY